MVRNSFLPQIFCGVFIYKSESFELQLDASVVPVLVGVGRPLAELLWCSVRRLMGLCRQIASEGLIALSQRVFCVVWYRILQCVTCFV